MAVWKERPIEIANLFNPAFCAVVLRESVRRYVTVSKNPMPYPLMFLILPIILHQKTRSSLPRNTNTKLHSWLHDNPAARVEFAERAERLIPYTKEAIIFGLQREILILDEQGNVNYVKRKLRTLNWQSGTEPDECVKKAAILGCWFAESGDTETIYALWGVSP